MYLYPPKLFWKFTITYRGMLEKVWACVENVSVMYYSLPRHERSVSIPTEIVLEIYPDIPRHVGKGMGMC